MSKYEDNWSHSGKIQIKPFSGETIGRYLWQADDLVGIPAGKKSARI